LLRKFAVLTIVAATASTLLDLMFRVRVAEHYLLQSDRLHFLGLFQSMLNLSALLFQAAMGSLLHKKKGLRFFHLHPAILFIASCFTTFAPGFWAFTFLRGGEYSLRNSLYRLGSELTYACLPDDKRGAIRPLIDVIGERLGDVCASGILAFLLFVNPKLPVKLGLLLLALCSLMFWWMCRSLEGELTAIGITARRDLALSQTANYGAIAQESAGIF